MISEEPLIDQERRKDEEYLVIIAYLFVYLTKTTTLLKRSRSDLGGSMISEEPLIDQERRKDEEYLVIIAFLFVNN